MPRQYGLIGKKLGHSFSKDYFNKKFSESGTLEQYELFELDSIHGLNSLLTNNLDLVGLNVTIPFKIEVIPLLHHLSDEARIIGAVNTIQIDRKNQLTLTGYNTDAFGFERSIKPFLDMHHQRAIVLGNGGASRAVQFVLKKLGIDFMVVSRHPDSPQQLTWSQLSHEILSQVFFIINTTPVGMYPAISDELNIPYASIGSKHFVVDLIYNPLETVLLKKAAEQGAIVMNGLNMLYLQAEKAYEIWNTNG